MGCSGAAIAVVVCVAWIQIEEQVEEGESRGQEGHNDRGIAQQKEMDSRWWCYACCI